MAKNPTIEELYGKPNIPLTQQFQDKYPGVSNEVAAAKVAEGWTPPTEDKSPVGILSTESAASNLNTTKKQFDDMSQRYVPEKGMIRDTKSGALISDQQAKTNAGLTDQQTQEGGMSFEDAYDLFGDDFTGIKKVGDKFYPDASAYERVGISGMTDGTTDVKQTQLESEANQAAQQVEGLYQDFLSYNVDADPAFQSQVNTIKAQYDKMRRDMERINESRQRQLQTMGMVSGTTRYAGGVQLGIEGEELSQANKRIAEINRQESAAISQARSAYENGQYQKFAIQADLLKDVRDQKQQALTDYNNKLVAASEAMQKQQEFNLEVSKYLSDVDWRNSQIEQFWAEYEQKQTEMLKGEKPMVVSAGSSIFDPNTGEFLGTAPKPVDTSAPEIKAWNGMIHQWDSNSQSWITLGSENDPSNLGKLVTINGKTFVQQTDGTFVEPAVPDTVNQQTISILEDKLNTFNEVLNNKQGLKRAVGEYATKRWTPFTADKAELVDFVGKVEQLTSEETINTLLDLKKAGGTLGALSDQERIMLQNAATAIGNWKIEDKKTEKVKGYEVSEDVFIKEIKRLQELTQKALKEAGGTQDYKAQINQMINSGQVTGQQIQEKVDFWNQQGWDWTDEDIYKTFSGDETSFNTVGSDTKPGEFKVSIAAGIAKRTNNPGNLVYIGQAGAKKDPNSRFAMFDTPEQGFRALVNDLKAKQTTKGRLGLGPNATLAQLINVYAPPSENATNQYIQQISSNLGVSPNTKLSQIDTIKLAKAIAKKESSTTII